MNNLRQLCAAVAFTFVLALPAFAGWISIPKSEPPPPPTSSVTTEGHIEIPVVSTDPATEMMLSLLQSALSLF